MAGVYVAFITSGSIKYKMITSWALVSIQLTPHFLEFTSLAPKFDIDSMSWWLCSSNKWNSYCWNSRRNFGFFLRFNVDNLCVIWEERQKPALKKNQWLPDSKYTKIYLASLTMNTNRRGFGLWTHLISVLSLLYTV